MSTRDTIHLSEAGISITVLIRDGKATIAIAYCKSDEPFIKKSANEILDLKLFGSDYLLKSLGIKRDVITKAYSGHTPRRDILYPIADFIREQLGYAPLIIEDSEGNEELTRRSYPPGSYYDLEQDMIVIPNQRTRRCVNSLRNKIAQFADTSLFATHPSKHETKLDPVGRQLVAVS